MVHILYIHIFKLVKLAHALAELAVVGAQGAPPVLTQPSRDEQAGGRARLCARLNVAQLRFRILGKVGWRCRVSSIEAVLLRPGPPVGGSWLCLVVDPRVAALPLGTAGVLVAARTRGTVGVLRGSTEQDGLIVTGDQQN